MHHVPPSPRYRAIGARALLQLPQAARLGPEGLERVRAVAAVLPFRINPYVAEELIDWQAGEADPMYRITIPQAGMLPPDDLRTMLELVRRGATRAELEAAARPIRARLNPHPAGQVSENVPVHRGDRLTGLQHKYDETVLFFPAAGQTCHTYCTYCFRWAQFVSTDAIRFAERDAERVAAYLRDHPEVTDVLITGGDPLIMKTRVLRAVVEPLLSVDSVRSLRIGTKSLSWWPQRFVTDPDADDLLRLFEDVVDRGRHLALMAHYTHPRELSTPIAAQALRRARGAGAVVRCQAPILRGVNDSAAVWASLWRRQVSLGAVPYYLFVARDTGPKGWFEVPLVRALRVFRDAWSSVSGLARTVRGPSMSATPGKVVVRDVVRVGHEHAFLCQFLQARDGAWAGRTFFARFDAEATWLDELRPAFGAERFPWQTRDTPRWAWADDGVMRVDA